MTLAHHTCSHGRAGIIASGNVVVPLNRLVEDPDQLDLYHLLPGVAGLAWFTDLVVPDRMALGLTSFRLKCDRTEHTFLVDDDSRIVPWLEWLADNMDPRARRIAREMPGMPRHWFVSQHPVPVREAAP